MKTPTKFRPLRGVLPAPDVVFSTRSSDRKRTIRDARRERCEAINLDCRAIRRQRAERAMQGHSGLVSKRPSERSSLSARSFYKRADRPGFTWIHRLSARSIRVSALVLEDFMQAKGKLRRLADHF